MKAKDLELTSFEFTFHALRTEFLLNIDGFPNQMARDVARPEVCWSREVSEALSEYRHDEVAAPFKGGENGQPGPKSSWSFRVHAYNSPIGHF